MTTISTEDKLYLIMVFALVRACKELSLELNSGPDGSSLFIKFLEYGFGSYSITSDATRLEMLQSREKIIKETPEFYKDVEK